ncbi:MAG: hypothetical protein Q9174_000887 [Haloplaca sp. 1 TL-2023]
MSHPVPPAPISAPPSRSTTDPPSSKSTHHHHHHIHRPHRHHGHHRESSRVPQSAVVPSSSNPFKDNSSYPIARDLFSPLSKVGSRFELGKHDAAPPTAAVDAGKNAAVEEDAEVVKRRERERESRERGVWAEVERRRRGRGEGDGHLSKTLASLTTLSTSTTRRLDYTHYSLLSHLSSLLATLSSLSSLSASTTSLHDSFHQSTSALERDTNGTLRQFEDLTLVAQQDRARGLAERVEKARDRVLTLEARLECVRENVERGEGWEREKGRKRRWRWKCLLVGLLLWGGLLSLGGVARRWRSDGLVGEVVDGRVFQVEGTAEGEVHGVEEINRTVSWLEHDVVPRPEKKEARRKDEWDKTLRILDEL